MIFDSKPGTPTGDELEVLGILIESTRMNTFLLVFQTLLKPLSFGWNKMGYNQSDLAKIVGLKSRASEILSRKRKLRLEMVRLLHDGLKIPTEVLVQANN